MSLIVEIFFFVGAILVVPLIWAADELSIYHAKRGNALIINSSGKRAFMVVGGAVPHGVATAGDCFVKANIELKKRPNYYEGDLLPVKNELISVAADDIAGKGVGVYIFDNRIRVGNVELEGVCADGMDFFGYYNKIENNRPEYESIFTYFMNLADQNAMNLARYGDIVGAKNELGPFVLAYTRWRDVSGKK